MKGVKQVQNLIKLAEFSQKQWENMIIDIKWRFHQQPHDRPRWICPVYSRGGGHDDLRTYKSCDKRRKPWGNPGGKSYWHWHYLHSSQSVWCQLSERLVYTSCELHVAKPAVEMGSCPWTVCFHWATEEQGHSRLHQLRDLMLFLPSATKERRCSVCDEITDVFHK